MSQEFRSVRDQLLSEFPLNKVEGLNIARAVNFIKDKGLEVKPFVIFDAKDLRKVWHILGQSRELRDQFTGNTVELYSPEADVVVVRRDLEYEEVNGPIYTEGMLVHGLAHATTINYGYSTTNGVDYWTPRSGLSFTGEAKWGQLLEEGWADINRATYVAQNATEGEKTKLEKALQFGRLDMEDTIPLETSAEGILPMPVKYLNVVPGGEIEAIPSSYAGFAAELLCDSNPAMQKALIDSRKSVGGLRQLAREVDRIKNGLYLRLQGGDYSPTEFLRKLSMVIMEIGGGVEKTVKANGILRNTWNRILDE